MTDRTGNLYTLTSFWYGGRRAGHGCVEDDYSENSMTVFGRDPCAERVRFPSDDTKPEDLNGQVIIVQKGKAK